MFFFKQKTAYEMRISDWSSDVCSSDLVDEISVWHGSSLPLGGESSHGRRPVHSCRFLGVSRRRSARGLLDSHISRYGAQRLWGIHTTVVPGLVPGTYWRWRQAMPYSVYIPASRDRKSTRLNSSH